MYNLKIKCYFRLKIKNGMKCRSLKSENIFHYLHTDKS